MKFDCRICASSGAHQTFCCTEKMFGLGGEFTYFQCADCGCLQIATVPQDMGRYYPVQYYSLHLRPFPQRGWKAWLAGRRDYASLTGQRGWTSWLPRGSSARPEAACLSRLPLRRDMRMLDVGCGRGQLLSLLHRAGFRNLAGIDPYLSEDTEVVPGLIVRKQALEMLEDKFDLIMFHHVFEHLEDGRQTLTLSRECLKRGGKILLRIPTVDGFSWERYRENWVHLDAPRHLFLHSRTSLGLLAAQVGLKVESCWCDSGAMQFWASELYEAGIPLADATPERYFSAAQMSQFERDTKDLNAANRGDQLVIVLSPAAPQPTDEPPSIRL